MDDAVAIGVEVGTSAAGNVIPIGTLVVRSRSATFASFIVSALLCQSQTDHQEAKEQEESGHHHGYLGCLVLETWRKLFVVRVPDVTDIEKTGFSSQHVYSLLSSCSWRKGPQILRLFNL